MNKPPAVHGLKFLNPNPPTFPDEEVREIAGKLFGLEGAFKPLISERDRNFYVHRADGGQFVLKIANIDETPDVVDLQVQALRHIERVDPDMPVPRVVPTRAGEACAWVEGKR